MLAVAGARGQDVVVVADQRAEAEVGGVVVRTEGERVPRSPARRRSTTTSAKRRTRPCPCRYLRRCVPRTRLPPAPARLPVRHEHRQLPDRGRRRRGRPGPEHLGHLLRRARTRRRRQLRRGRVRPLPPRRRGRRADGAARHRRLPLLDRVAADPAHRSRTGQREGAGVLRPARRHPARPRPAADGHALPLGPPAGPRGRRRLAQPGDRGPVRRLRRDRGRQARRPGRALGAGQRAQRRLAPRLRHGARTPPARRCCSTRCGPRTTCSSRTAGPPSSCAGRARRRSGAPTTTPRCGPPATTTPTWGRASSSTRCGTGCSSSRCCWAATPRTSRR